MRLFVVIDRVGRTLELPFIERAYLVEDRRLARRFGLRLELAA